jgi:hypothetical protein
MMTPSILKSALLARKTNPDVRVVVRVTNDVLGEALAEVNGSGAIFNVAELAAPAIVEACLADAVHTSTPQASSSSYKVVRRRATAHCAICMARWPRSRSFVATTPLPQVN